MNMDINVCRICCENKGTNYIFDNNLQVIQISRKIMYCCKNIYIHEDDGLPVRICGNCDEELSHAYQFVLKCEVADKKLHSLILKPENNDFLKSEVKIEDTQIGSEDNNYLETHSGDLKLEQSINIPTIKKNVTARKDPKCRMFGQKKCKECGKQCINQSTLLIHMRIHSNDRPHACNSCDKKYKDNSGLKRHIERNHNRERKRQFICESCGKAFFSKYEVKTHMRSHTGETPYPCTYCPLKFTQSGALLRHSLRHTGEKAFSCTICNKKFHTKEDLKRHETAHTNEKKFVCPTCNSPFKYSSNLRKHIIQHTHLNKFICNHCNRTFNAKGSLKVHIKAVHSGNSGFCNICSKDVSNIEVHMWRHTGKRPLKCDLCSSSFFEKKALSRHINFKHKYTDKYKCSADGCTGMFPSQPMLDYHVAKFHGSVIPFPCESCPKGFYRRTDLARHKVRYHLT